MGSNRHQSHRAIQHLVDGGVVFGVVGLPAADNPDIGRGRLDAFNTIRQPALHAACLAGSVPCHRCGTTAKFLALVPLVRLPGTAKTSVPMSTIGSR